MNTIFNKIFRINMWVNGGILYKLIINSISLILLAIMPVYISYGFFAYIEYKDITYIQIVLLEVLITLIVLPLFLWSKSLIWLNTEKSRIKAFSLLDSKLRAMEYKELEEDLDNRFIDRISGILSYDSNGFSKSSRIIFSMPALIIILSIYLINLANFNRAIPFVLILCILFVVYYTYISGKAIKESMDENSFILKKSRDLFDELSNIETLQEIRIQNSQPFINDRYIDLSLDFEDRIHHVFKLSSISGIFTSLISLVASLVFIYQIIKDRGVIANSALVFYSINFMGLILFLTKFLNDFETYSENKDLIKDFFNFINMDGFAPRRDPYQNSINDNISMDNVEKRYKNLRLGRKTYVNKDGKITSLTINNLVYPKIDEEGKEDKALLEGLSLNIKKGETVAIVGRKGSGKSDLLNIMAGIIKDYDGQVKLHGNSVSLLSGNSVLLPFSLGENLSSEVKYDEERLYEIIKLAKIHEILASKGIRKNLKGTYISNIFSQEGKEFTDEERMKILYARLLYLNKDIILIDEGGVNISIEKEIEYTKFIKENKREDVSFIYTTENIDVMELADRVLLLHGGYIAEEGTFEDIKEFGEIFKEDIIEKDLGGNDE